MYRLMLIAIYVFLSFVYYFFPTELLNDGKVFTFALICVFFLKELDWYLIKESCKNSKNGICKIFRKSKEKNVDDKNISIKMNDSKNEEKSIKEKVMEENV